MKKFTFILLGLISGTAFAQQSATAEATATVNAEIVSPIKIETLTNLDFGRIIGNTAGGVVTIKNDGTRTISEDMYAPNSSNSAPAAASFNITAANDYKYSIEIPETTLTSGTGESAQSMAVKFTHDRKVSQNVGSGTEQLLNVGGELTVGPGQAEGIYTGEVKVTVAYE